MTPFLLIPAFPAANRVLRAPPVLKVNPNLDQDHEPKILKKNEFFVENLNMALNNLNSLFNSNSF